MEVPLDTLASCACDLCQKRRALAKKHDFVKHDMLLIGSLVAEYQDYKDMDISYKLIHTPTFLHHYEIHMKVTFQAQDSIFPVVVSCAFSAINSKDKKKEKENNTEVTLQAQKQIESNSLQYECECAVDDDEDEKEKKEKHEVANKEIQNFLRTHVWDEYISILAARKYMTPSSYYSWIKQLVC